jgi:4-hydroxy-tetrahydrodipicolinate synthase
MYTQEQKSLFRGVGALVLTPFHADLSVDYEGIKGNARYIIDNGIKTGNGFLIANGTMSECYALSMEERKRVIRTVVEAAAGEVPVIAGCNDTAAHNVVELARYAQEAGVQAIMVTQPFYIPHSDEQMFVYFQYIHDHVDIPIMIYNNPLVGGRDIPITLLRELAKLPKIFGLKQATERTMNFVHSETLTDKLLVFAASSSQQPFASLARMSGFVSFISSVNPGLQLDLWRAIEKGDLREALVLHAEEMKLYDWWWSGGIHQPAGGIVHMKKAMDLIGLTGGHVRPPLVPGVSEQDIAKLKDVLEQWGLL